MHADASHGPMSGLPDPERDRQFYEGVPLRRLVAWFVDVAIILLIGVPLAVVFGLLTLGFGFALFPLIVAGVGFLYRTATLAGGSATWGMRFTGIEFRRRDGTPLRPRDRAPAHRALHGLHRASSCCSSSAASPSSAPATGQSLADIVLGTTAINRPAD